jgi:hypothetical protein
MRVEGTLSTGSKSQNGSAITKLLLNRVRECIHHSSEIAKKDEIFKLLDALDHNGSVAELGSDDLRGKYVFAQGSIEHVLACAMVLGEVDHLVGVIHTPTPATPLCTQVDNLDDQLLDPSIRYDLEKLLTVRSRAVIVREYLELGGKLFIAYPKGGLEKRTQLQQETYKQELAKYADRLYDAVLSCTEMDPAMVGATYLFKDALGTLCAFSIKSTQANNPQSLSEWAIWFGKIKDPLISQRVNEILDYLEANDGPNVRVELAAR